MEYRIIHHSADCDGIMSATIAKLVFSKRPTNDFSQLHFTNDTIKFFPYNYEPDADWMHDFDQSITTFIFIDVTPTIEFLSNCPNRTTLLIFDHHKMKYEDIMEVATKNTNISLQYFFDDARCGSKIFYDYVKEIMFNGHSFYEKLSDVSRVFETKLNYLVDIVNEYDIWSFAVNPDKNHRELVRRINAFLSEHFKDLSFKQVIEDYSTVEMEQIGREILWSKLPDNLTTINSAAFDVLSKKAIFEGKPTYELQASIQELAPKKQWGPMLMFFCNVNNDEDYVTINVRSSIPNTFDCAKEARTMVSTGGGHHEAASCRMSLTDFANFKQSFIERVKTNEELLWSSTHLRAELQEKFINDWL